MHQRKLLVESWWRPNIPRGTLVLIIPPYRVSARASTYRIVHGIMELCRALNGDFRWLVTGDDDSIFLVDNLVDVLSKYDHNKRTPSLFIEW
ncbi:hypothetical protein Leryth_007621 [Lithospermum erythrorhizon]|nr:hypothetical protein Leryth_007621 [Lithospermum erythrorhizon]